MKCAYYYHHQPYNVNFLHIKILSSTKQALNATAAHCVYFGRDHGSKRRKEKTENTIGNIRSQVYWLQLLIKLHKTSYAWRQRHFHCKRENISTSTEEMHGRVVVVVVLYVWYIFRDATWGLIIYEKN